MLPFVESVRLIDHHCHGVVRRELDRPGFEALLTETSGTGHGGTLFDSQIGLAVRRWCAPVVDLPAHATPDEYLARRAELGTAEVTERFVRGAGLEALCVDTGFEPEPMLSPSELGAAAGAPAYHIVRLERIAEDLAAEGTTAAGFGDAVRERLASRAAEEAAVAVKSIAAYRVGLELADRAPDAAEVTLAAGRWLSAIENGVATPTSPRLADERLHRFLIFAGVELGLPVQFHVGYGDRDLDLHRCNPLLLTGLLRTIEPTGVPVMLLHNYPYHREAGYLAQVFGNVYVDIGLAMHNVGRRASVLLAEALELTPFGKFLHSSDAFGLPELHYLGAVLFRRALSDMLADGLTDGAWTEDDAVRFAELIGAGNARRVYGLPSRSDIRPVQPPRIRPGSAPSASESSEA